MKLTKADFLRILARNKQITYVEDSSGLRVSRAELEQNERPALDPPLSGAQKSGPRTVVCITGYRTRPCDSDNFAGGCKALLDCLRHACLIADDSPQSIELRVAQVKVARRREERTEVTIEYYNNPHPSKLGDHVA